MTQIKFDSKVIEDVADALEDHADAMFKQRKGHWMAVVELAHVERTEPGPDEEKSPSVKLRIVSVEVAGDEFTDERLRELLRGLYASRTKAGTLDSVSDDVDRADSVLRAGSGVLTGLGS